MATAAVTVQCWLDPPLTQYFPNTTVNWRCAIVDALTKLVVDPTTVVFQWTNPPYQDTPQVVANVKDSVGLYHVFLPLPSTVGGKVILSVLAKDGGAVVIGEGTLVITVYPSGQ